MSPTSSPILFNLPIRSGDGSKGSVVCTEPSPQVYLLTFSKGPDNRLITAFCRALILALDIIELRYPPGVVITTSAVPKFYSNGMDIEHSQFTRAYMPDTLYALWHRLLTYTRPTIALINGHAFAGGMMVAMMHDYRVMNPHKGYLCLNELELGMPLRPPMLSVFRMKLNAATLRKLLLEAYRFKALDALKEGIVDHLGGLDETLAFVDDLQLVKKAQPGGSGKSVYGELKREMWRETVDLLEGWAEEHVRDSKTAERSRGERKSSLANVEAWERTKAKLSRSFNIHVMTNDCPNDFLQALATIAETHSDCTITCGTHTFKLHKIILHLHSRVFATKFSARWESISTSPGVVNLDNDDDPEVMQAMSDYFYKFEYEVPDTCSSVQAFHVRIFRAADKYQVSSLQTYAHSRLAEMGDSSAWSLENFEQVAELVRSMEVVPAAGRMRDLAVSMLKRQLEHLTGDPHRLDFITRHPDWIRDVMLDMVVKAAGLRRSLAGPRPAVLTRTIS